MGALKMVQGSVLFAILAFLLAQVPSLFRTRLPSSGSGFAAPGWRKVADAYRQNLDSGLDQGSAFALYHRGELVVEFSGGYADHDAEVPWTKETLCQIASSSKGVAAITTAMLVDRGLLDYKQRVSHYWPEFAQHGKADVTVEQLLSHQAGLAAIDEKFVLTDLLTDPDKVAALLAAQVPNWTPGEAIGYHGHTIGLYMDQLVRRVDPKHRNLPTFFREEVAEPFDLDIYFGLPKEENDRAARVYDMPFLCLDTMLAVRYWPIMWTVLTQPESVARRSIINPSGVNMNNPLFREVWNPSTHAFGTAVGLAKLVGIVANGGSYKGKKLASSEVAYRLIEPVKTGDDLVLKMNLTYGRGTTVRDTPLGTRAFGTPGAGGQMVYGDPAYQVGWAYITNYHTVHAIGDDPRYLALEDAIYDCLSTIDKKEKRKQGA